MAQNRYLGVFRTLIAIIIFFSLFFLIVSSLSKGMLETLYEEYPLLQVDQRLDAVVTSIDYSYSNFLREDPNTSFVTLNNTQKFRISAHRELVTGLSISDVLKRGVHLKKSKEHQILYAFSSAGSDTIKYTFKMDVDISPDHLK